MIAGSNSPVRQGRVSTVKTSLVLMLDRVNALLRSGKQLSFLGGAFLYVCFHSSCLSVFFLFFVCVRVSAQLYQITHSITLSNE